MKLNIVVVELIPRAMAMAAKAASPGALTKSLKPWRRSLSRLCMARITVRGANRYYTTQQRRRPFRAIAEARPCNASTRQAHERHHDREDTTLDCSGSDALSDGDAVAEDRARIGGLLGEESKWCQQSRLRHRMLCICTDDFRKLLRRKTRYRILNPARPPIPPSGGAAHDSGYDKRRAPVSTRQFRSALVDWSDGS